MKAIFFLSLLFSLLSSSVVAQWTVRPSLDASRYVLVDALDREVLFRGVNLCLQQWWLKGEDRPINPDVYEGGACPPNDVNKYMNPPICGVDAGKGKYDQPTEAGSGNDLAQIRELGFDLVRLGISWSLLEPSPGDISKEYLDRIEQVVRWGAEQDIAFIIDFHTDFYSFSLNGGSGGASYKDGAPAWAVLNNTIDEFPQYKRTVLDKVGFDWHTVAAFETFYANQKPDDSGDGMGIQEHYIRAFAETVSRFNEDPAVLGFEIMNEPAPSELRLLDFSASKLYPFYARVIQAVTGVRDGMPTCDESDAVSDDCAFPDLGINTEKVILFEPMAVRNQLDFSVQRSKVFTEYASVVYAPHTYTESFTIFDPLFGYQQSLDTAWWEATKMKAGLIVTEFGGPTSSYGLERLGNITKQQDEALAGSTFWTWKERSGGWSMWDGNEGEKDMHQEETRRKLLSRARPKVVVGGLDSLDYNPEEQTMLVVATAAAGEVRGENRDTVIYVPVDVKTDKIVVGGAVSGDAKVEEMPDGSRLVTVTVASSGGEYKVGIGRDV